MGLFRECTFIISATCKNIFQDSEIWNTYTILAAVLFPLRIVPLDNSEKTTADLMKGFLQASDWPASFLLFQVLLPTLALDQPLSCVFWNCEIIRAVASLYNSRKTVPFCKQKDEIDWKRTHRKDVWNDNMQLNTHTAILFTTSFLRIAVFPLALELQKT